MNRRNLIISVVVIGLFTYLAWNWQDIRDHFALAGYTPTAEIAAIAQTDTMTTKGKQLFYVTHPTIYDRTQFSQHCPKPETGTEVLGCYEEQAAGSGSISLFKITNPDLADEIDITAAHEMLHSAYAHLKPWERQNIQKMLDEALTQIPESEKTDVIKNYLQEGNYNELHSHIGTEIPDLPADLEAYYSRYFSDRRAVALIHQGNEALFADCKTQTESYKGQLAAIKAELDDIKAQIEAMRQTMDEDLANHEIAAYNALVPQHNRLVDKYNADVRRYNQIGVSFNGLVSRCNALSTSFDSSPEPIQPVEQK